MKMSTRDSLICLFTGLALCALPACGPTDPSEENNKTSNNGGVEQDMNGGGTDNDMNPGTGTDDMDGGSDPDMKTGGADADMGGGDTDMGEPLGECAQRALYEGQIGNTNPAGGGGGAFALGDGAYEADSGLGAVLAAAQAAIDSGELKLDDESTADVREDEILLEDGSELVVTGAVITATAFERKDNNNQFSYARSLYFQDQQVAANIFLPAASEFISSLTADKDGNPIVLKVGDKINFKVKMLKVYADAPQIGAIIDVEKVGENVDVGVDDRSGMAITAEDLHKLVRVHGTIESKDSDDCGGGKICYTLKHGDESHTFRIGPQARGLPTVGDCITYVGPVNVFMNAAQLNAENFVWYRGPFAE